jgi:hypothetical protein
LLGVPLWFVRILCFHDPSLRPGAGRNRAVFGERPVVTGGHRIHRL